MRSIGATWLSVLVVVCLVPACVALGADDAGMEKEESGAAAIDVEPADSREASDGDQEDDAHAEPDYSKAPIFFDAPLFLFTIVLFGLFLVVSRRLAWNPLINGLDAREARINKALQDARAARSQAEELLRQHQQRIAATGEEVRGIVAAARREAEQSKSEIISAAEAEAEQIRNRALADIDAAHEQVLAELSATIDQYAESTTSRLLSR